MGGTVPLTAAGRLSRHFHRESCSDCAAMAVAALLDQACSTHSAGPWLAAAVARIAAHAPHALDLAWGEAGRRFRTGAVVLDPVAAGQARPGWNPRCWSADQIARTRLLLAIPHAHLGCQLDRLSAASTVEELVALYQAFAVVPEPTAHRTRAAAGVRSNMLPVYHAIALDNPYPLEQLDDEAWSQLVLKAFFTASPIERIVGLEQRRPQRLRTMLADYARERSAAHRPVDARLYALL